MYNKNYIISSLQYDIRSIESTLIEYERLDLILSVIIAEILNDNKLTDYVSFISIRDISQPSDVLTDTVLGYNSLEETLNTVDSYGRKIDNQFKLSFSIIREQLIYELETIIKASIPKMSVYVNFMIVNNTTAIVSFYQLDNIIR